MGKSRRIDIKNAKEIDLSADGAYVTNGKYEIARIARQNNEENISGHSPGRMYQY